MAYDQILASRVRTSLGAQSGVEEKKMFGGVCFMVDGRMCCGVLKDELFVRVGAQQFKEAIAQPHVRPFNLSGRPSPGMVYVSSVALSSAEALEAWVQRGLQAGRVASAARMLTDSSPQ